MILCYAWTNIQIINLANTVAHDFAGEPADLLLLNLKRIDPELVGLARKSGIFRSVSLVDPYMFPEGPNRLAAGLRALAEPGAPMRYYRHALGALCEKERYGWLLTSGYFAETLFVLRLAYAANPQIRVAFVEEGTGTYYHDREMLCRSSENGSLPSRCKQRLFHGGFLRRSKRLVNTVYLYDPAFFRGRRWGERKKLPPLTPENPVYGPLLAPFAARPEVAIYTEREYYYIASPFGRNALADERQNTLIAALCRAAGESGVVVKLHPSNLEDGARPMLPPCGNAVLDDGNYPLEAVLCHVDLGDKVIASDCSTLLMVPKLMLGQEPCVLFLYRLLCEGGGNTLQKFGRELASDLKAVLPPEKVQIPASFEELSDFIKNNQGKVRGIGE